MKCITKLTVCVIEILLKLTSYQFSGSLMNRKYQLQVETLLNTLCERTGEFEAVCKVCKMFGIETVLRGRNKREFYMRVRNHFLLCDDLMHHPEYAKIRMKHWELATKVIVGGKIPELP